MTRQPVLLALSLLATLTSAFFVFADDGKQVKGPVVVVTTSYRDADAVTVADSVATPIEQQLKGVESLVRIESESRGDGSYIARLHFERKADPKFVQALVSKGVALAQPQLPEAVRHAEMEVILEAKSPPTPSVSIALTDLGGLGRAALQKRALEVKSKLESERVANRVELLPGYDRVQRMIRVDPKKCALLKVDPSDVLKVLGQAGPDAKPEDFNKLNVKTTEGKQVPFGTIGEIKDVAQITVVYRVNLYPAVRITGTIPEGKTVAAMAAKWVQLAKGEDPKSIGVVDLTAK